MCERSRTHVVSPVRARLTSSSQLLTIAVLSSLWSFTVPASSPPNDFQTLICLKLHLSNSTILLDSWNQNNSSLHFCSWPGVTCSKAQASRVVALDLDSWGLDGQIPPCIANLTLLTRIHFPNNLLTGVIPSELGQLSRLSYLNLSSNSLSGMIPNTLSSASLQVIDLGSNSLRGEIPKSLGMLPNISVLHLAGNSLTGNIPLSLGSSSSLLSVVLTNNSLTGPIPSALTHSSSLKLLDLTGNNLGGEIPPALFNNTSLQRLSLGWNYFVGSIPASSNINSPLQFLTLSVNDLTGTIPSSLGNFSSLRRLRLAGNKFHGSIPASISKLPNLQELDMSYNNLSGPVPASIFNMSSLTDLSLSVNRFTGSLPSDIGHTLPSIRSLIMQASNFEGQIPHSLANATNLESINLGDNAFHGIIPSFGSLYKLNQLILASNQLEAGDWTFFSSLTNCTQLEVLSLGTNMMQGNLPSSVGSLANGLRALVLHANKISGTIPPEIGNLTNLVFLRMEQNQFVGSLPDALGNVANLSFLNLSQNKLSGQIPLSIGLDLSHNKLSGQIPLEIGGLINIGRISFSDNNLSGKIPTTLGACLHLETLHMEGNFLDGRIPDSFINLRGIAEIDLSRNNLSGEIPKFFQSLNSLKLLNLSFNNLDGQVPTGGIFQNSSEKSKRSKQSDHISFNELKNYSYADLTRATNSFSSDNLLGSGTYGSVYKGVLEPEEQGIAIKVFKLDKLGAPKSFVAECNAFRNIRHRNIVRVISACSTWDHKGNDFKALIIEYMANGTLESWLYSEMERPLSLSSRATIAVDIASALDYLHNHSVPPIVHCDLKPSNVLLDDGMGARLSDFGLAKFLHSSSSNAASTSLGPRGSIGYIAPEYGFGSKISTEGDVYSYGVIILEMLTGKRPTDKLFSDGLSLHKFVGNAFPQNIGEILDPNIIPNLGDGGVDNNLDHATVGRLNCITQLIKLGLSCCMDAPKDRPTMVDVYAEVTAIKRAISALGIQD
ncbi:hypothetical protein EJB05_32111, partial [Eragrostis curvula]